MSSYQTFWMQWHSKSKKIIITHINNHLINLTNIDVLNRRMASYFTKYTTISSSNNQNLQIIIKTVKFETFVITNAYEQTPMINKHPILQMDICNGTFLGFGIEQRGRWVIISWYAHSSLSVSWITPSKTRTFPYVADWNKNHCIFLSKSGNRKKVKKVKNQIPEIP